MSNEETSSKVLQLGIPLRDFEAAVETLDQLQGQGKLQIFLARENAIRFVGESDEFSVTFATTLGSGAVESRKARECLEEVQSVLQVVVAAGRNAASEILEASVYRGQFSEAKGDSQLAERLRNVLEKKVELVSNKLASEAMLQRAKRLTTTVGPLLEDMDIELVSQRRSLAQGVEIAAPFLRIRFRYSLGGQSGFPIPFPPWIPNPPRDVRSFELECDETDIDLLLSRLVQAKELLKNALEARVEPEAK